MYRVTDRIQIDVHISSSNRNEALTLLGEGFQSTPPWIASRFFYDDAGSKLFETICTLPEYYQTRTEYALLESVAPSIIRSTGAQDLVELGSGAALKTRVLLDAMRAENQLGRYVPFDVNEMIVRRSAEELTSLYPKLEVHGVVGKFRHHLPVIPEGEHRLFLFLGGTIGNFTYDDAVEFLAGLRDVMGPEDALLLGTDLIKDRTVLEAAYNDSRGITAEFNRNILHAVNHLTGSAFDPEQFEHQAFYNEEDHRIEMWLKALSDIDQELPALESSFQLSRGKAIRTEISTKFDLDLVTEMYRDAGLEMSAWHTDPLEYFALSTARKAKSSL